MKYIIDVSSDLYTVNGTLRVPVKVGNGDLSWYNTYIKAEPYTEPDRKAVENEVWDFATSCIDMDGNDFCRCFEYDSVYCLTEYTYSEAKAKYDEWKKQKEEIRVGDEIEAEPGKKACVLYENPDGTQLFVFKANGTFAWWSKCKIHKTGKKYSEIAELLKKMRDSDD